MLMLKETIIQGWPKDIKHCPLPLHNFWNFRDELSIIDGIVVKGNRIVIPTKFQLELLSLLHDDSHLGIDKCIQQARGNVYWPNISEDIKSIVNKCEKCLANCQRNQKEPYIPFDIPIVAWKSIATDLFTFQDKTYVVVVDVFSCFPVVRQLHGSCYKSQEFNDLCAKFDIVHQTGA